MPAATRPAWRGRLELALVDSHLWVSLAAAGLTLFVATVLQLPARLAPAAIVLTATWLVYSVDDRFDDRGRPVSNPGPLTQLLAASGVLLALLWRAPAPATAVVVIGGLPALLYGMPLRGRRLRDLPGVKPLFVSGALAVAVVAVPWAWAPTAVPAAVVAPLGTALFLLVLANVSLFDLRDLTVDARHGVHTVPVLLGPAGARVLCAGLGAVVLVGEAVRPGPGAPALAAAAVATILCAWRLCPDSGRLAFALAVDGIPVALGVWACLAR